MDDREIGQRQGDQGPQGISDDRAVGLAVDHESLTTPRQRNAPGRPGPLEIEQGDLPQLQAHEETAAPIEEGDRRDGRIPHPLAPEDPTAADIPDDDRPVLVPRGETNARGVESQGADAA